MLKGQIFPKKIKSLLENFIGILEGVRITSTGSDYGFIDAPIE